MHKIQIWIYTRDLKAFNLSLGLMFYYTLPYTKNSGWYLTWVITTFMSVFLWNGVMSLKISYHPMKLGVILRNLDFLEVYGINCCVTASRAGWACFRQCLKKMEAQSRSLNLPVRQGVCFKVWGISFKNFLLYIFYNSKCIICMDDAYLLHLDKSFERNQDEKEKEKR